MSTFNRCPDQSSPLASPPYAYRTWLRRPMRRMNSPCSVVSAPMRKMPKTVTQARPRLMRKRKMLPPISCCGGERIERVREGKEL
jgi:hypothetical protein